MADNLSQKELHRPSRTILWRWAVLLGSAATVVSIDQITKSLVTHTLSVGQSVTPIPALGSFFAVTLSHNTGAAFSILPQAGDLFLIIAIAMIIGIMVFYRRIPPGYRMERIALGMLLGGTLGNALDRLEHGYVVDWVHLQIPGLISNVSNLADHAIVLGILILFLSTWRGEKSKPVAESVDSGPVEPRNKMEI